MISHWGNCQINVSYAYSWQLRICLLRGRGTSLLQAALERSARLNLDIEIMLRMGISGMRGVMGIRERADRGDGLTRVTGFTGVTGWTDGKEKKGTSEREERRRRRRNSCGQTNRWKLKFQYKRSSRTYKNRELEMNIPMQLCKGEYVCVGGEG